MSFALVEISANIAENVEEHAFGQFSSEGILLAGMVGRDQTRQRVRQAINCSVTEREGGEAGDVLLLFQDFKVRP